MSCLNHRAFEILKAEVLRCSGDDLAGKTQREIVLKRLEKLKLQPGTPPGLEGLRQQLNDLFPNFDDRVLQAAARANQAPTRLWNRVGFTVMALGSLAGGMWLLNLPYPMIRVPVSRLAPIVLLPSFFRMDYDYRQAIAQVEQADQLVNQPTSPADLELGATHVKAAQTHLDALPVWFLGYYPQAYCSWAQCSWRFTLDEFQDARKSIARMDARLFQEKNAQVQLQSGDQSLGNAKQQYQEAPNGAEKQAAIAQWQQALDTLRQIPSETLAGHAAQTKLIAYERDFQQVVGFTAENAQSGNLIQAAKDFAETAQKSDAGKPHSVAEWQEIERLWNAPIERLRLIRSNEADYLQAQKLLASYEKQQGDARVRQAAEQQAVAAYEHAQTLTQRLLSYAAASDRGTIASQLQEIENTLRPVTPGTTVYADAQVLRHQAAAKRKQIQP